MPRRFQQAARYLQGSGALGDLLACIERNAELLRAVRRALPPPLDAHCLHAAIEDRTLTLVSDSPVWASRLRFLAPEVQRALNANQGGVASIRVRVQPVSNHVAHRGSAVTRPALSAATIKHLLVTAENVADEGIAAALRRLAEAGKQDQAEAAKGRM